jgi:integrase
MANLAQKDGIYYVRFRFHRKEYRKSLKTRNDSAAQAALHVVELTIHRLHTGQTSVPEGVDPGDFIVSGGTLQKPIERPEKPPVNPSTQKLIDEYIESQKNLLAPTYHYSQVIHLRHLRRHLGELADAPCDKVGFRDLDRFLKARLATRNPNTAERERITLLQFFKWIVQQGHLADSPASGLLSIKGGVDRPPFRTIAEINRIIERGGLTEEEVLGLWECLYLTPQEIGGLLETVRERAHEDVSFPLHAIPAYTGMRRGEVLKLRWIEVDLEDDFITARSRKQSRKKTETVRRIDMHPELKRELVTWREQRPKGQYVICDAKTLEPLRPDLANRYFWQPMRKTDWCLDGKHNWFKIGFHTYRHSFASNLAAAGVDQRVIDEFMGHQTEAMRRRYRHLYPKARRSAIESFSLAQAHALPVNNEG